MMKLQAPVNLTHAVMKQETTSSQATEKPRVPYEAETRTNTKANTAGLGERGAVRFGKECHAEKDMV